MDGKLIRYHKESLSQKVTYSMRDNTISLHLSEPKSASSTSAMSRLPRNGNNGPSRPRINFVVDHMPEALVIDGPNKDEIIHHFSSVRVGHPLIPIFLILHIMDILSL